jgi:hypothetical protein
MPFYVGWVEQRATQQFQVLGSISFHLTYPINIPLPCNLQHLIAAVLKFIGNRFDRAGITLDF